MNAFSRQGGQVQSASVCLNPTFDIIDADGNTLEFLGHPPDELVRRSLGDVAEQNLSTAIIQCMAATRRGADSHESRVGVAGSNLCVFASPVSGQNIGIVRITIQGTEASLKWQDTAADKSDKATDTSQQHDRDGFLDLASQSMTAAETNSVTMVHVFGGLGGDADDEMRQIVHSEAMKGGATATSRLDNGSYGILHPATACSEQMFDAIGDSAIEQGVIDRRDRLGAEEVTSDTTNLDPKVIRATLADSSSTLASRIASGFRRLGLGRRVDETKRRVAELMVDIRKAVRNKAFYVEARPILNLRRSSIAIHEVRAHPVVNGFPVETSVVEALGEDPRFAREMQIASVDAGLKHHHDLLVWQSTSLRIMVSVTDHMLLDRKIQSQINGQLHHSGVAPRKLILRACKDHANGVPGQGESYLEVAVEQEWRVAVPDFYAFIKAEASSRPKESQSEQSEAQAYIEVDTRRLTDLCAQKDGRHLMRGLIETWRGRQTEIVATGVSSREQLDFLKQTGIRYAKGSRIGDWQATA